MNSNLNNICENASVPQDNLEAPQVDLWEPPFERWMRIADSLLNDVRIPHCEVTPKPQTFVAAHGD
jgi:hypothetical protein